MRVLLFVLACAVIACGAPPDVPSVPDEPGGDSGVADAPDGEPVAASDHASTWLVSTTVREIDGLPQVVAYRGADEVAGLAEGADVLFFARCVGDRTEVEFAYPVALGDDVYNDADIRTKRVILRLPPSPPTATVWPVAPSGTSLLVAQPVRFLRQVVLSDSLYVQTTSVQGSVLFSAYALPPGTFQNLRVVAEACDWQLDVSVAALQFEQDALDLLREQRASVLETYLTTPIRDGLERSGVDAGDLYFDLPAPVGRAYLGYGVTIDDVDDVVARRLGIVCVHGEWVLDEIVLADCYPETDVEVFRQLAPHLLEGPNPVIRPEQSLERLNPALRP